MSELVGNRYQITKLIGKGGMAEVFLGWDSILNREVAIKILKSDMSDDDVALERFKREAIAATQLSHPNIVDVYDVGDDGDKHYIVMEYVKGYTLKQLIKNRGAIPYKEAVWMMKQLAGALMEAHRKGIIHRDIKSQNVLIKPDGTIKLSDFGIALANGSIQITSKDSVLGSVHYLAPELTRGRIASMQSDIYSLGIVFYELLTGDVPFKADTPVQVALMHVKNNIPSVRKFNPEIPQSVENIVIKATAKSLTNRYKNIALMLRDLNDCLKPEHKFDDKLVLDDQKESGVKATMIAADDNIEKQEKKRIPKLYIAIGGFLSAVAVILILFLSGVLGSKSKNTVVPNILNLTVLEARDILSQSELLLDDSRIEYELSDSIEKDRIISVVPAINSEVEKNTRIKLTVSSGIYAVLDNYVGMNYLDAKKKLEAKNFKVRLNPIESEQEPGKVLKQEPEQGYKYDENVNNEIKLTYSLDNTFIIDTSLQGAPITYVDEYFNENKIPYTMQALNIEDFKEEELIHIEPYTVIRTEPEIGTSFSITPELKVIVYYLQTKEGE